MDDRLITRIFDEIDRNVQKIEDLSKIVYTQATTLGIVTKLVMLIITFMVIAGLTMFYDHAKNNTEILHSKPQSSQEEKK